jgi:hypothetical protein
MAINFTVSYTFSPSTTISSSQVNTNFSDNAAVWQGLEAETKSFAKLKVDIDPTLALEVATKQYVDHYSTWRRPVLQFGSVTTVAVESGLDGTSGDIPILFPDGTVRTETSTTRTTFDITRNAVLVTSGAQSGLTGATSEATNTWYALYACKVTDSSTLWVTVGSTVLPLRANYATLNTAYGTNGWVYLGLIRNGDNAGATGDILTFVQNGNTTFFQNLTSDSTTGMQLARTASAQTLSASYSAGTGALQIPNNIGIVSYDMGTFAVSGQQSGYANSAGSIIAVIAAVSGSGCQFQFFSTAANGTKSTISAAANQIFIYLNSFVDNSLGVGSNPLL